MSDSRIFKSWGAGCTRQAMLAVIIFIILVTAFIGLVVLSVLLPLTENQRISIWISGSVLFLLLMAGTVVIGSATLIRRRTALLDAAFNPLGLTGNPYLWNGRQFHSTLNGRQVDAYFYRGPSLDIYIASPVNTRLGIALKGCLTQVASNMLNRPELVINDPELAHLNIFSLDISWGRELLYDPRAKTAILRLTSGLSQFEFRNILFQPEAVQLQIHRTPLSAVTTENLRLWVNDLLILTEIAEALPSPDVTATATDMERRIRLNRSGFILPIMSLTCAIIGFFGAVIIVIVFLFLNLTRGGL